MGLVASLKTAPAFVEREFRDTGLDLKATLEAPNLLTEDIDTPQKVLHDGNASLTTV